MGGDVVRARSSTNSGVDMRRLIALASVLALVSAADFASAARAQECVDALRLHAGLEEAAR